MLNPGARLALAGTRFTDVRHLATIGSTNGAVAALARHGAPEGLVLVADHQTGGRGRRGRTWEAPPGSSLLVSVLLRPPAGDAHLAGMATALAAVQACAEVAGVAVALKWPNDLVADQGKLGGILAEVQGPSGPLSGKQGPSGPLSGKQGPSGPLSGEHAGDGRAVVVGLGLNLAWDDPLPPAAVDLRRLGAGPVDRDELLVRLLVALEERCRRPDLIVSEYRSRCSTLGRSVRVELGAETLTGTAVAVDADGRLVVATETGERLVASGDVVHVR